MTVLIEPRRRSDRSFPSIARNASLSVALCALLVTGAACSNGGAQGNGDVAGRQGKSSVPGDVAATTLLNIAERLRSSGDPTTAVSFYRRAMNMDPHLQAAYIGLGETLLSVGAPNEAVEAFHDALGQWPNDPAALRGLGLSLVALDRPSEAIDTLNRAIKADPSARAYSALGVAQNLLGNGDAADQAYRQGLALAPDDLDLLNNLGLSQALRGDYDAAIDTLHHVATDAKAAPRHRLNLALVLGLAGRSEDAARVARIDLDERSVKSNLAYYATLRALSPQARASAILRPGAPLPSHPAATCDAPKCPSPAIAEDKPRAAPTTPVGTAQLTPEAKPVAATSDKDAPKPAKETKRVETPKPQAAPQAAKPAAPKRDEAKAPAAEQAAGEAPAPQAPAAAASAEAGTPPAPEIAKAEAAKAEPAKAEPPRDAVPNTPPAWDHPTPLTNADANPPASPAPQASPTEAPQAAKPAAAEAPTEVATAEPKAPPADATPQPDSVDAPASTAIEAPKPAPEAANAEPQAAAAAPAAPEPKTMSVQATLAAAKPPVLPSTAAGKHTTWIQLASFRSEQNARNAWQNMANGNKDLLQSLLFSVRKVDLGTEKGTFYVLRMGPFETIERAHDLCSALRERNIECLVAR